MFFRFAAVFQSPRLVLILAFLCSVSPVRGEQSEQPRKIDSPWAVSGVLLGFSKNGDLIVGIGPTGRTKEIGVVNTESGEGTVYDVHAAAFYEAVLRADGKILGKPSVGFSPSAGGAAMGDYVVCDYLSGDVVARTSAPYDEGLLSPDGLAFGGVNRIDGKRVFEAYNADSGDKIGSIELGEGEEVALLGAKGQQAVVHKAREPLRVVDVASGAETRELDKEFLPRELTADGMLVVSIQGFWDAVVMVIDSDGEVVLRSPAKQSWETIGNVPFHLPKNLLAAYSPSETSIGLFEGNEGELRHKIKLPSNPEYKRWTGRPYAQQALFSPDGKTLYASHQTYGGIIRIDTEEGLLQLPPE